MQSINEHNINEAFSNDKPLVLKFYAEWCGPCRMYSPIMENVANNLKTVKFFEVNIDEQPNLAGSMNVTSVPTTVLVNDSRELSRFTGIRNPKEIHEWLNTYLPGQWNKED